MIDYVVINGQQPQFELDAGTRWVYLSRTNESITLRAGNGGAILAVIPKNGRGAMMFPQEITLLYCEFSSTSTLPAENQEAIFIVSDQPIRGDIHGEFYKLGDSDTPYNQAAFVGQSLSTNDAVSLGETPMPIDWTVARPVVAGRVSPSFDAENILITLANVTVPSRTVTYYTNTGRTVFPRGNQYTIGAGGARLPMFDLATSVPIDQIGYNVRIDKCIAYIYDVSGTAAQLFGIDATYEPTGYVADSPAVAESIQVDNLPYSNSSGFVGARRILGPASVWNNDQTKVIARQEKGIVNGGEYVFDLLSLPNMPGRESPVELKSSAYGRTEERRFIVGFQCGGAVTFRSIIHCVYSVIQSSPEHGTIWG